jgi:hypothetical protein
MSGSYAGAGEAKRFLPDGGVNDGGTPIYGFYPLQIREDG